LSVKQFLSINKSYDLPKKAPAFQREDGDNIIVFKKRNFINCLNIEVNIEIMEKNCSSSYYDQQQISVIRPMGGCNKFQGPLNITRFGFSIHKMTTMKHIASTRGLVIFHDH